MATERADGDAHPARCAPDRYAAWQRGLTGSPWVVADQVHGVDVLDADAPDVAVDPRAEAGSATTVGRADVLVSRIGRPLALWAADCAMVVLASREGTIVAAHAGWRGLAAGVIDVAVDAAGGPTAVDAVVVGPVVHPECYEFGDDDLSRVAAGVHAPPAAVRALTSGGLAALDVPAALTAAFAAHGLTFDVIGP